MSSVTAGQAGQAGRVGQDVVRHRGLRILVLDGHRLIAESVAGMLPMLDAVRSATSVTTVQLARARLRRGGVDLVLADDAVHGVPTLDLLHLNPDHGRRPRLVFFSSNTDPRYVARSLRAGACGWVVKDCAQEELGHALTRVTTGARWVSSPLRTQVIEALLDPAEVKGAATVGPTLSPRRREVLRCLVEGLSHGEAAERLGVSLSTVRTHVRDMCRLTGTHSTPELVAFAREQGLVGTDEASIVRGG